MTAPARSNSHLDDADVYDYRGLRAAVEAFEALGEGAMGFDFSGDAAGEATLAGELVELVLDVREQERAAGNYDRADALRDDLEALASRSRTPTTARPTGSETRSAATAVVGAVVATAR